MLVDTNAILSLMIETHPRHEVMVSALQSLLLNDVEVTIVPQNLVEFWVVATRPLAQNGLGITPIEATSQLNRIKGNFALLSENELIYPVWESLVTEYSVSGKPSHDARLVAAMKVHGLTSILTFDKTGFSRFPGIKVVHPAEIDSYLR